MVGIGACNLQTKRIVGTWNHMFLCVDQGSSKRSFLGISDLHLKDERVTWKLVDVEWGRTDQCCK